MPNYAIVLGHVGGGVVRGLLVGAMVTVIALFFTRLSVSSVFITVSVVLLTAVVFSLAGLINAIFARKFDDVSIVPSFVLAPLTYLGGVFYSISLLPDAAQFASKLNPILYMVNAFRYGVLGVSDVSLSFALGMIGLFTGIAFLFSMHLLNAGTRLRQ